MERAVASFSRRNILITIGAAAAGAAALLGTAFRPAVTRQARKVLASTPLTRGMLSLSQAEMAEWTSQIGSTFTVGGGYALQLAGVEPLPSAGERPAALRDRAFAAVFDVARGGIMPGDLIYTVSHPQYGPLQMFLSSTSNPRRMLAIFN
jgi:hypothetical protein